MRYFALATDFDGTLACGGLVQEAVLEALTRLRASGRRLVMVTGRELADLMSIFPHLELFDTVVVENGATIYQPATGDEQLLAERPPDAFIATLKERQVSPLSIGRVIVATLDSQSQIVLDAIRDQKLELQVIFNKGTVMVLPSGVNKATGLQAALEKLGISPHNVVAVGDAENDHALLNYAEFGVAVANSVPTLLERADLVSAGAYGWGVIDLVDRLLTDDLADDSSGVTRHDLLIGRNHAGNEIRIPPHGMDVLVCGGAGCGPSNLTTMFLDSLIKEKRQFVVIDPLGEFIGLPAATQIGSQQEDPSVEALSLVLNEPGHNAIVNLRSVSVEDRARIGREICGVLNTLQAQAGRPHWVVINEAQQLLPCNPTRAAALVPESLPNRWLVTRDDAEGLDESLLTNIGVIFVTGPRPRIDSEKVRRLARLRPNDLSDLIVAAGDVARWSRESGTWDVITIANRTNATRIQVS